jgi:hypothetical protein
MTELVLRCGVEIGRMALNVAIDNSRDEGWSEVGVVVVVRPRDYIDKRGKVRGENRIGLRQKTVIS